MSATMAKQPKPQSSPEPGGPKPISFRPSRQLAEALDEFLSSYGEKLVPPSTSAIVAKALEEFLANRGFKVKKPD